MKLFNSLFRITKTLILLLLVAFVVSFCLNNSKFVTISLWPLSIEVETRLFILILISFLIGFSLASFVGGISLLKARILNFFAKNKIKKLQNKLDNLPNKDSQN